MAAKSLGERIPGTGNLYFWGDNQILKYYGDDVPLDFVERLGRIERELYEAGLPVPAVGELIKIDGGMGQIYERIEGDSIAAALFGAQEHQQVVQLANVFAETQARIHAFPAVPELALQWEVLPAHIERISNLPADLKKAVLEAFAKLPIEANVYHGDYHPFNVILSPRGPVVIDWNNALSGSPMGDVARSILMLSGTARTESALKDTLNLFNQSYQERYFELRPEGQSQLAAWEPIAAAIRLLDGIPEIETWLLEKIRDGLGLAA